jgi:hypothetical protein
MSPVKCPFFGRWANNPIFLERGGKTLIIRGQRPGEAPTAARARQPYADDSSHNTWGTDPFGFLYHRDRHAFCDELRAQGVRVPVPPEGRGRRAMAV